MIRRLVLATLVAAAPLEAQSAPALADRAAATWAKVRSARATFEQTVTNPLTGSSATAHGEFAQLRPDRLAIRFTDPAGDRIVADGRSVWIYLPSSTPGQVLKRPATDDAVPVDFAGQFLDEPRARFDITGVGREAVGGRPAHVLLLVPRPGTRPPFTRAKVWVDDDDALVRQFEVVESSGITRRVRLTSVTLNPPLDRDEFTFTPPKGVKVVEER